ncbi:MAG: hypothetical protein QM669_00720 [Siphonobacter sp.]
MIRKLRALLLFYGQMSVFPTAISVGLCWMSFGDDTWGVISFIKLLLGVLSLILYRQTYRYEFIFLSNLGLYEQTTLIGLLLIDYLIFVGMKALTLLWS